MPLTSADQVPFNDLTPLESDSATQDQGIKFTGTGENLDSVLHKSPLRTFPASQDQQTPERFYVESAVLDHRLEAHTKTPNVLPSGQSAIPHSSDENATLISMTRSTSEEKMRENNTPPKKMLRIRPDGKLLSPKAKLGADERKGGKRRKISRSSEERRSLVVVFSYAKQNDNGPTVGKRIQEILSRTGRKLLPASGEISHPSRPTHPFFTGGLKRDEARDRPKAEEKQGLIELPKNVNKEVERLSVRKARVNSKPPDIVKRPATPVDERRPTIGTDFAKVSRFPGAREPLWPPCDMLHIGIGDLSQLSSTQQASGGSTNFTERKLKEIPVQVPADEDVTGTLIDLCKSYTQMRTAVPEVTSKIHRHFRRPQRRVMTGIQLQAQVQARVSCPLPDTGPSKYVVNDRSIDQQSRARSPSRHLHPALLQAYACIHTSLTAFDQFRCETLSWSHKYAPRSADQVLQRGKEAVILRDWLKRLSVFSTEPHVKSSKTNSEKIQRKKRRRIEEMDGFLVSSDDDNDTMDAISEPDEQRSLHRSTKGSVLRSEGTATTSGTPKNVAISMIISGPHGCGKTAAVYAVAQELGFEVFEINSGSRRSGKDILDRVGDMARNHLVNGHQDEERATTDEDMIRLDEKLKADISSGRQGTMQKFFQPKQPSEATKTQHKQSPKKMIPKGKALKDGPTSKSPNKSKTSKTQNQKQSLILLEEVDVLFEEDRFFWATTLDLIEKSKRPVVLTCSDESLLPIKDISPHGILRFTSAPESLAVDYLLLVAANEGHLLCQQAVKALYTVKGCDLRAAMVELNFWCQMGIGDQKGGLEWMLINNTDMPQYKNSPSLRVISEGTYESGMGWFGGEMISKSSCGELAQKTDRYLQLWKEWGLDPEEADFEIPVTETSNSDISRSDNIRKLVSLERSLDALSAADLFPSQMRQKSSVQLDKTIPDHTIASRLSYPEQPDLLQADPCLDHTGLSESLALTLRASAESQHARGWIKTDVVEKSDDLLLRHAIDHPSSTSTISQDIFDAFEPLARFSKPILGIPKGPSISNFDGPLRSVVVDLAPCARSIVSYDMQLERQRRELSALLSHPGAEPGRTRTTRASRAALEGGDKANTRREKWFPKDIDSDAILRTGGDDWQAFLTQRMALSPLEHDEKDEPVQSTLRNIAQDHTSHES